MSILGVPRHQLMALGLWLGFRLSTLNARPYVDGKYQLMSSLLQCNGK
jgi:hypothetical protein